MTDTARPACQIIIAGGGFAGVRLARLLARNGPRTDAAGRPVRITLIDRHDAFTYTPLLYEVAAGKVAPAHATTPYRDLLWDRGVSLRRAEITGFDLARRIVHTGGRRSPLRPARAGARRGLHAAARQRGQRPCRPRPPLHESAGCRDRSTRNSSPASARHRTAGEGVTVVVAGGGPKGVELIFDLADYAERRLAPAAGIARERVRLVLVDGERRLMNDLPPSFDRAARAAMRERGIRLIQGRFVVGADDTRVLLDDGHTIAARTLIWTAGITAHPLIRTLGLPLAGGRAPRHREPATAGLSCRLRGRRLRLDGDRRRCRSPATASLAQQHGRFLARALAADLAGLPLPVFRAAPRGQIIKLGDGNAIAQLGSGPHAPSFTGRAAHALRSGFDLLEVPGIAQKRGTLGDFLRR